MIAERADLSEKARHVETLVYETASAPVPSVRALELLDGSAQPIDVSKYVRTSKRSLVIRKFPVPATGRYFVRVSATRASIGNLVLDVRAKPPKKDGDELVLDPESAPLQVLVGALDGARLQLGVRSGKKSAARPVFASVTVPVGGLVTVVIGGADGGSAGPIIWSAKLTSGKGYGLALPDVTSER